MNRGAWQAIVHGVAELDMTEHTHTHTHTHTLEDITRKLQTKSLMNVNIKIINKNLANQTQLCV